MIYEKRDIIKAGVKIGELELPEGTDESVWQYRLSELTSDPVKVFTPVRPMYMRLALMQAGLIDTIETALQQQGREVERIAWEYALEFKRDDRLINGFAQALGLTTEQVDSIFETGAALQSGMV